MLLTSTSSLLKRRTPTTFSITSTSAFRWGATMNQLGNVLARDRRFIKVGFDENTDIGGFRMRVCVWARATA